MTERIRLMAHLAYPLTASGPVNINDVVLCVSMSAADYARIRACLQVIRDQATTIKGGADIARDIMPIIADMAESTF